MKPGIYDNLSNKEYHASEGISSSGIKHLIKSPAHYKASIATPTEPTPEMIKGSVIHTLILEPHKFEQEFAVGAFNYRRGKEYDKAINDNPGKIVISESDYDECLQIVGAFKKEVELNPLLKRLLEGDKEHSFYWNDFMTNVLCKCRPDNITPDGVIVDIKTSKDASKDYFQKALVDLGYFISAAFYLRGVNATRREASKTCDKEFKVAHQFCFIVIETKAPFSVALYYLDRDSIKVAEMLIDKALEALAKCQETGNYEGYSRALEEIGLPKWAYYKFDLVKE